MRKLLISKSVIILARDTTLRRLAFCLKAIPQTYRFGLGARYYRMDTLPFWVLLVAGLVLGVIAVLKIIVRNNAV